LLLLWMTNSTVLTGIAISFGPCGRPGKYAPNDALSDLGLGHPLLGRRMPDLDLVTAPGPRRAFRPDGYVAWAATTHSRG